MAALRLVVDTQVLASGLVGRPSSPAREIIRLYHAGVVRLILTGTLVSEVELTLRALGVGDDLIGELLSILCGDPEAFVALQHQVLGCRDPHDDHIIEAAFVGNAHAIVTRDRDILELPTMLEGEFRRRRIRVFSDREFVEWLRRTVFSPLCSPLSITLDDLGEPPAGDCLVCGHGFHWDLPSFDIQADEKGEPRECECFAEAVTGLAT